jgi:hypothetical protein
VKSGERHSVFQCLRNGSHGRNRSNGREVRDYDADKIKIKIKDQGPTLKKGGCYFGALTQGGAALALGWYETPLWGSEVRLLKRRLVSFIEPEILPSFCIRLFITSRSPFQFTTAGSFITRHALVGPIVHGPFR